MAQNCKRDVRIIKVFKVMYNSYVNDEHNLFYSATETFVSNGLGMRLES